MKIREIVKRNRKLYISCIDFIEWIEFVKRNPKWAFPKVRYFFGNLFETKYVPVLAFHWFVTDEEKKKYYSNIEWYASINDFEKQIIWLRKHRYYFLSPDEFSEWMINDKEVPRKSVLITFDDGEISQIEKALPILKKYDIPSLCFVIGKHIFEENAAIPEGGAEDTIDYFNLAQMKEASRQFKKFQFGAHSYNMHFWIGKEKAVNLLSRDEINKDCKLMREKLPLKYFAYPFGRYNETILDIIGNYYKICFAFNRWYQCPYAEKGNDLRVINRIKINGDMRLKYIRKYLF